MGGWWKSYVISTVTCCTVTPLEVSQHMAVADMDKALHTLERCGEKKHTKLTEGSKVPGNYWKLHKLHSFYAKKVCFASCSGGRKMHYFRSQNNRPDMIQRKKFLNYCVCCRSCMVAKLKVVALACLRKQDHRAEHQNQKPGTALFTCVHLPDLISTQLPC